MMDGQKIVMNLCHVDQVFPSREAGGEKDEGGHERHEDRLVSMGKKQAWRHQ